MNSRRQFLRRSLVGLAAFTAVDAFCVEPNRLSFETIEVGIRDLPSAFDGDRIALIADFHYPRGMAPAFIRRAISMANAFDPDLMALPGDFTDRKGSPTVPNSSGLFDHARARDGVVGVLGNHDHWLDGPGVRRELARHTPVRLIENVSFCVERGGQALAVGGVGDLWCGIVAPERAFAGLPPEMPRILLSHNPDVAEEMAGPVRVDLQLSGHTHGGQVYVPYGGALQVPSHYGNKFRAGLVQGKHHRVYVTRGVFSSHHIRFCCLPEVTGITLRSAT